MLIHIILWLLWIILEYIHAHAPNLAVKRKLCSVQYLLSLLLANITLKCKKKKSTTYSRLSDVSLSTTLVNSEALEEKEAEDEETSTSAFAKLKNRSKYFAMRRFGSSHRVEPSDYSAYLESVEEGNGSDRKSTPKSASKSSRPSRYLTLKGRSTEEVEEKKEEGSTDGTGNDFQVDDRLCEVSLCWVTCFNSCWSKAAMWVHKIYNFVFVY